MTGNLQFLDQLLQSLQLMLHRKNSELHLVTTQRGHQVVAGLSLGPCHHLHHLHAKARRRMPHAMWGPVGPPQGHHNWGAPTLYIDPRPSQGGNVSTSVALPAPMDSHQRWINLNISWSMMYPYYVYIYIYILHKCISYVSHVWMNPDQKIWVWVTGRRPPLATGRDSDGRLLPAATRWTTAGSPWFTRPAQGPSGSYWRWPNTGEDLTQSTVSEMATFGEFTRAKNTWYWIWWWSERTNDCWENCVKFKNHANVLVWAPIKMN